MGGIGKFYRHKCAVVTGGLGFIGSNLALRLAAEGAQVTVIDPCVPGCGGNPLNLAEAAASISVVSLDIGSPQLPIAALSDAEVVFNLAGEVSHPNSMRMPERDLSINTVSQLRFLQALAAANPGVRIVYAGTRQVYGCPEYLPVDEAHPVHPVDFNGVHKYAATMYHLMLSQIGLLDACVMRLTNIYGPRQALDVPGQGVLSVFVRRLLHGRRLDVFGDGSQLRDPLYVDDAIEAFLLAGAVERLPARSYNLGGPDVLSLSEIANIISEAGSLEPPLFQPFPADQRQIDIGSYYADWQRIKADLGWQPEVGLEEGIRRCMASSPLSVAA